MENKSIGNALSASPRAWIAFLHWGKPHAREHLGYGVLAPLANYTTLARARRIDPETLPRNIIFIRIEPGTKAHPPALRDVKFAETITITLDIEKSAQFSSAASGRKRYNDYAYVIDDQKKFWIVEGTVYSSETALSRDDVIALANESTNRKRKKLEKAHALMDMSQALDKPSGRKPIPQEVKLSVWRRDQGRCVACGKNANLEFDHIIPVSMGGANTERNLQLLCIDCNRQKGASL